MTEVVKCWSCDVEIRAPKWLEDENGTVFPMCEPCAMWPWPMWELEGKEVERAELAWRREQHRMDLATRPPDELAALIVSLEGRVDTLQEREEELMTELGDAIGTRDSLSDQLIDTRARLAPHLRQYPRMMYHRDGRECIVQSAKSRVDLKKTGVWFDAPDLAEAARIRKYNIPAPPEVQEVAPSRLASMTREERAARMGAAIDRGGGRPETDRDRVDVSIEMLERPKLGSK
jgi:hypothetical protein